jgi:hypothetical protein
MDEDAVVEGEDSKFDGDQCEIVKMAEDVVALAHHHLVISRYSNDMPTHAMGWTCCC